jgi:hypothetical protein
VFGEQSGMGNRTWFAASTSRGLEAALRALFLAHWNSSKRFIRYYVGRKEISMIELTEQQRRQLATTDVPQMLDPEAGKTYVLVATEVYEQLRRLLEEEPRVTGEMVDRLMEEEDRDDPTLALYQEEYGRKS